MDKFYAPVLIGALVLLIVILIVVGVIMMKLQSTDSYPPTYATCPDYWDVSANTDYCGVFVKTESGKNKGDIQLTSNKTINMNSANNVGMCNVSNKFGCKNGSSSLNTYIPTGAGFAAGNDFQYLKLNNNDALTTELYPGTTDRCAKKRWADTMGITWDGVTNFNGC